MTTRDDFVARFGEEEAVKVEEAVRAHRKAATANPFSQLLGVLVGHQEETAEDQFLLDLAAAVSYQCITKEEYREYHGIQTPTGAIRDFLLERGGFPDSYQDPACPDFYKQFLRKES